MLKDKNILVITDSADVNDSSGSKTNVAFINSLWNSGARITVLHYTRKDIRLKNMDCISINEIKSSYNYLGSRMHRVLIRWFNFDISKYIDSMFGFSFGFFNDVNSISKELRKFKPADFDMVWTFGKGTSFRSHAAVLNNPVWHAKWYAYVHDPYPQHLYPRPYNFVEYGFKKKRMFFREITIHAHRMVFPSLMLKEWMQSYYLHVENKSLIIPHQLVFQKELTADLPSYFNKDKFNMVHAGNLLDLRDPKPIIHAFEQFLVEVPEAEEKISLLFIGPSSIYNQFMFDKKRNLPQLEISDGYVTFEVVNSMQQQAVVNIILEAKSEISPFLPGKFPHCVGADKPIILIGPYYSECKRLLGNVYPYCFDFDQIEALKNAIKYLYEEWKGNTKTMELNRPDLSFYLSSEYMKNVLENEKEYLC